MILVIDNKNHTSYFSKTKTQVAKIIGVHRNTIYRWERTGKSETFNNYTVYFNSQQLFCSK